MYFVPGNNGSGDKNTGPVSAHTYKRRLLIGAAVFFLIIAAAGVIWFRLSPSGGKSPSSGPGKYHPLPIDAAILQKADFGLPVIHTTDKIIRHLAYTVDFSAKDEEACWVAYTLRRNYLYGTEKRTNRFEADPDLGNISPTPEDYRNSGYDKGHLAPAADMKWDKEAMKQSFYLSNVCPQDHRFNDGIWADLEKAVRKWAGDDSIVYVVTGPVLPAPGCPKIGADHITVPSYFYKVVFSPFPYPKAIGFIIPNQPGRQSFWYYACTLNQVEKVTQIKFFKGIPAADLKDIEDNFEINDWRTAPVLD